MKLSKGVEQVLSLVIIFILIIFFWNSFVLYPIKLFVVLLHEMSHAIVAALLGGTIHEIQISKDLGGFVIYSIPQNWFKEILVLSSGYLGSMLWGGIILVLSSKISSKNNKYITLIIGIITLFLGYYAIKSISVFSTLFCIIFGGVMIVSYRYLDDWFHKYMLKIIGMASCLYVILDIKSDLIDRSGIGSDADRISQITHIPSVLIGIFWIIIAIYVFYFVLRKSSDAADNLYL